MLNRRMLILAGAAAALAGSCQAQAETDWIDGVVEEFGFNGVVLLGENGRPTFEKAYGIADAETGRAASVHDRYIIASISKWMTVTAILRLVEQGEMNLDTTIADSLPDFRKDTGARVTLRHLLSNTSGIPNQYGPAVEADPNLKQSTMTAADAARAFCSGDLVFEPGARFDYAITNWILVVAMVEAATGRPFERVVDDMFVAPLGLKNTQVAKFDFPALPDTAKAYSSVSPPILKMSPRPAFLAAAGGFCSTARDLLTAASGVFDTSLLTPQSRAEMLKITTPEQHYALGGRVARLATENGTREAAWETGRTDGYRSVLGHILDERRTVVLLNNADLSQQTMDRMALRLLRSDWA